jgi:C-terminal processing protease CtpA/Prc
MPKRRELFIGRIVKKVENRIETKLERRFSMSRKNLTVLVLAILLTGIMATTVMAREPQEKSQGGWLGVYLQDISPDMKDAMDLKSTEGVLVTEVVSDSPAEKAGLESKDVIVEFAEKGELGSFEKVEDAAELKGMVKEASPGEAVKLKILRDGKEKVVTVTLSEAPESDLSSEYLQQLPRMKTRKPDANTYFFNFYSGNRIGVKVQDLSEQLGDYFGVTDGEGVLITEVEEDMPAYKAGLKAGDVVVEVDGKKIEDTEELTSAISEKDAGDKVNIKVMRNHQPQTFAVGVEKGKGERNFDFSGMDNVKIFKKNLQAPDMQWMEQSSSDLKDEMEDLKQEMQDLKQQLEELKEKIR